MISLLQTLARIPETKRGDILEDCQDSRQKDSLLLVLKYPEFPLRNNSAELGVSFYPYIHDRISSANQIPPLADLVTKAAKELNLGWSFSIA